MTWLELLGQAWWDKARNLSSKIYGESYGEVYPPEELVFATFDEVSPEQCNLVILGQDPYHSPGKARGVAFGYHPDYRGTINSSLMNIIDEVHAGTPDSDMPKIYEKFDTSLRHWTAQGVLLLNTRLTVPHEQPMGHAGLGWEPLMAEALEKIVRWAQPPILAWGAEARKFALASGAWTVVDTSHPCRYSASRGSKPFLGSKCFEKVNEALIAQGDEPINWTGV